jgi:hypothetical protein
MYEELDVSLDELCRALGWDPFTDVPLINATAERPKRAEVDRATLEALAQILRWDIELYEFGKKLFSERLSERSTATRGNDAVHAR